MPSCNICERELVSVNDVRQYVHSTHTGNHYCLPGEGCWVNPKDYIYKSVERADVKPQVQVSKPKKRVEAPKEPEVAPLNEPFHFGL